jgi:hypothetical protein
MKVVDSRKCHPRGNPQEWLPLHDQAPRQRLLDLSQLRERPTMTLLSANGMMPSSTTIIYRPAGGIEGYREAYDKINDIVVLAFPWTKVREVPIAAVPACYLLVDYSSAYIGETGDVKRRFGEHARDSSKSFVREAYVIVGAGKQSELWSDSTTAEYLQYRLTDLAEQAGLVDVVKGVGPRVPKLGKDSLASLEALVRHSQPLLFDAGCRVFRSNCVSQRRTVADAESLASDPASPMRIGIIAAPAPGGELELAYGDLWVRGFLHEGKFVVMAGSEVRTSVNASAWDWIKDDRSRLSNAEGALMPIPGLEDRERLRVNVEFDCASSAAKVVTGSRDASRWISPRYPQPFPTAVLGCST